jgi:hypothetical protein
MAFMSMKSIEDAQVFVLRQRSCYIVGARRSFKELGVSPLSRNLSEVNTGTSLEEESPTHY